MTALFLETSFAPKRSFEPRGARGTGGNPTQAVTGIEGTTQFRILIGFSP